MTLHLNASQSTSYKILSFIETLSKKGESIEIVDDALYRFEKSGIERGLSQLNDLKKYSVEDILAELAK